MKNFIAKKILYCAITVILLFVPDFSYAEISDSELAQEIEKTLIFNDKSDLEKRISDITIDKNPQKNDDKPLIDMIVKESHIKLNTDIRTKEKLAYDAANQKQYEAAIELYKQVLESESENYYAAFSLATIYQKLGQFSQAKILYFQLLKNDPQNKDAIINNILALLIEESPKDAVYVLSRLSSQNPQIDYIAYQTAIAYNKNGNNLLAIDYINRAIALNPQNILYKYNLAIFYDQAGDYEKAVSIYAELIRNNQTQEQIPLNQVQKRLETIKNKV